MYTHISHISAFGYTCVFHQPNMTKSQNSQVRLALSFFKENSIFRKKKTSWNSM